MHLLYTYMYMYIYIVYYIQTAVGHVPVGKLTKWYVFCLLTDVCCLAVHPATSGLWSLEMQQTMASGGKSDAVRIQFGNFDNDIIEMGWLFNFTGTLGLAVAESDIGCLLADCATGHCSSAGNSLLAQARMTLCATVTLVLGIVSIDNSNWTLQVATLADLRSLYT